jgi:hypothetical protein
MVGVDHVVVYDNTDTNKGGVSELLAVAESFSADQLTYHVWPCKICNNNRPAHKNPGERSSQYAAEASCRTRYGELTEWMTFLDTDEYMVAYSFSASCLQVMANQLSMTTDIFLSFSLLICRCL